MTVRCKNFLRCLGHLQGAAQLTHSGTDTPWTDYCTDKENIATSSKLGQKCPAALPGSWNSNPSDAVTTAKYIAHMIEFDQPHRNKFSIQIKEMGGPKAPISISNTHICTLYAASQQRRNS
jgi:hypothetical protein